MDTAALTLLETGHTLVNPLPFPVGVFFLIPFVILMALLATVHLIGRTRPHS
ncbi:hypothetical protein [Raineyella antarctica]|nr:hypothetical protein [Raineyella antarctica]